MQGRSGFPFGLRTRRIFIGGSRMGFCAADMVSVAGRCAVCRYYVEWRCGNAECGGRGEKKSRRGKEKKKKESRRWSPEGKRYLRLSR